MDDLQARLDRAITEAREACLQLGMTEGDLDRYAALVALRARLDEARLIGPQNAYVNRTAKLEGEAERLLGREDT